MTGTLWYTKVTQAPILCRGIMPLWCNDVPVMGLGALGALVGEAGMDLGPPTRPCL